MGSYPESGIWNLKSGILFSGCGRGLHHRPTGRRSCSLPIYRRKRSPDSRRSCSVKALSACAARYPCSTEGADCRGAAWSGARSTRGAVEEGAFSTLGALCMMERFPAAAGGRSDCFPSGAFRQNLNCCYSGVRSLRILVQRYCSAGGIPQCAESLPKEGLALFSVPESDFQNALRKSRAVRMAYCCRNALP